MDYVIGRAGDWLRSRLVQRNIAMRTSRTIAGLMGPTLVAIAAGLFLNLGSLPGLLESASRDPALILLSGILLFVAGLAIVRAHNLWVLDWSVLVTVFGWLAVLGGLLRVLFPIRLATMMAELSQSTGAITVGAVVLLVAGAFLSIKGYGRE
jgi:hypothetical protein